MSKQRWELALELEHFIRDFIPAGWKEPISSVMFVPIVLEADIATIEEGNIPDKFGKGPMLWAVRSYMLKGK